MSTLEAQNDIITSRKMLTGMFSDRLSAENAFNELYEKGYAHEDINLVMTEDSRKQYFTDELTEITSIEANETGKGSVIGGALTGIITVVGNSITIPGIGILIAGPVAASLVGAGGVIAGIVDALVGAGLSEEHAKMYEEAIQKGNIVISVHAYNEEDTKYFENKWNNK